MKNEQNFGILQCSGITSFLYVNIVLLAYNDENNTVNVVSSASLLSKVVLW